MRRALSTTVIVLVATSSMAWADPGDLTSERDHASDEAQPIVITDAAKAAPCSVKAGVCLAAGTRTVAVSSAPIEPATGAKQAANAPVAPRFSRAASVASGEGAATTRDQSQPWSIDLTANLKRAAWAGNALFIFFDLEDPQAVENRQFTALYQTIIKAGPKMAAHLQLAPEEGFRPSHSYRLRIVQLIGGKEIVLAEGDVSLL
jgi:hypothetical protein